MRIAPIIESFPCDIMSTDPSDGSPQRSAGTHYKKWKTLAPLGLVAVGLGASMAGQSTLMKGDNDTSTWQWVAAGTASLTVLNAGLCLFGDAVKHRALYEWAADEEA